MGALLSTLNVGLFGCKPYTLFGKRLLPVIRISSSWVTASCNTVATLTGKEIRLIASRPIPRSTNENDAFYAWVGLKDKRVHNKTIVGIAGQDIPCHRTDGFLP